MNHIFKRVVVVLNQMDNIDNLLEKAVNFSNQHKTTLEVLFVYEEPLFKLPDYFLSYEKKSQDAIYEHRIKDKIKDKLKELTVSKEVIISVLIGNTLKQVKEYGKYNTDILFITSYHKSLDTKLLHETPHSFWIVKNSNKSYKEILLPIDLKTKSREVITATQHIFPTAKISVVHDYRFTLDNSLMEDNHLNIAPIISGVDRGRHIEQKKRQQELFENCKNNFNVTGDFLEEKRGLEEDLIEYIHFSNAELIVMYPEEIELFFSSDLIIELLHNVSKDFLVLNI